MIWDWEFNGKLNIATGNGLAKVILNWFNINSIISALSIESGYKLINILLCYLLI